MKKRLVTFHFLTSLAYLGTAVELQAIEAPHWKTGSESGYSSPVRSALSSEQDVGLDETRTVGAGTSTEMTSLVAVLQVSLPTGRNNDEASLGEFNLSEYRALAKSFDESLEHDQEDTDYSTYVFKGHRSLSSSPRKTDEELLAEQEEKEKRRRELVIYERSFSKKGAEFLTKSKRKIYRKFYQESSRPVALLKVAIDCSLDETRRRNLLQYLSTYDKKRLGEFDPEEGVSGRAASALLNMNLEYWNSQNFHNFDSLNLSALFSVLGDMKHQLNTASYFDTISMDDPGDVGYYFVETLRNYRRKIITWHVNTARIPEIVDSALEHILHEGRLLVKATTYGCFSGFPVSPLSFDLLYLLVKRGYVGFSQKEVKSDGVSRSQHIWVNRFLPISVRVKDSGGFSVGVLKQMPFSKTGSLEETFLTRGQQSEVFKVGDSCLIPARNPEKIKDYGVYWNQFSKGRERSLLGTVHFNFGIIDLKVDRKIEEGYFNFRKADKYLVKRISRPSKRQLSAK
jgi:hypothetical protein